MRKPVLRRWLAVALLFALPITLYAALAGSVAWRTRVLEHPEAVWFAAFTSNDEVISLSDLDVLRTWDTATGQQRHEQKLVQPRDMIESVDISADNKTLTLAVRSDSYPGITVEFWNLPARRREHTLLATANYTRHILPAPDGKTLLIGDFIGQKDAPDTRLTLRDINTRKRRLDLQRRPGERLVLDDGAAFSPDGKHFAAALSSTNAQGQPHREVRLWNVLTGKIERAMPLATTEEVPVVAFSHDGRALAAAAGKQILLWVVATGVRRTLQGHSQPVGDLCFTPQGGWLASGGEDRQVRIWDVKTGHCLRTLEGHSAAINNLNFAPDGRTLATASDDRTVRLWRVK